MKLILRLFLALLAALVFAGLVAGPVSPQGLAAGVPVTGQKMAIPTYFYPGPGWTRAEKGAPTVGLVIINPNSGPGASKDPAYAAEVTRARARGLVVLGYVYTSNGLRAGAVVKSEVDKYYLWYGLDGIFFDEADPSDCSKQAYYKNLYNYVKAKGGVARVVINPGTNLPECYISTTDIMLNFEGGYNAYVTWRPSAWVAKYPAKRFWQLVYATPQGNIAQAVAMSKNRNAGWVYVTPDVLANPWDTLPPLSYWNSELSLVRQ